MNDEYIDLSQASSGTGCVNLEPRLQELLQDHKSTWEANSRGGEPNHWEEKR